ncbi:MAG: hypothetical protein ABJI92_15875 [Kangiellaceae bacterium]
MLNKIQGRPLWYKVWAVSVGIAAIYVLVDVFREDGLGKLGLSLMLYTHISLLVEMYFFPDSIQPADSQEPD